jgi:ribonuclease G
MTRNQKRESHARKLTEACFYCEGKGYLKSKATICYEILRELKRNGASISDEAIAVACHPEIAELLAAADLEHVEEIERRLQKRVLVKARPSFHLEEYEIQGAKKDRSAAEKKPSAAQREASPREGGDGEADEEARPPR